MFFDGVYLEESKTALLGERLQRKTTLVELAIVFLLTKAKILSQEGHLRTRPTVHH